MSCGEGFGLLVVAQDASRKDATRGNRSIRMVASDRVVKAAEQGDDEQRPEQELADRAPPALAPLCVVTDEGHARANRENSATMSRCTTGSKSIQRCSALIWCTTSNPRLRPAVESASMPCQRIERFVLCLMMG